MVTPTTMRGECVNGAMYLRSRCDYLVDPVSPATREIDMIRLLYFSQAVATVTNAGLEEILATARRKNNERGITGALLTGGEVFLQILEGPEQSVLSLYLEILQDTRHTDVEIMRVTPIMNRLFKDWSMEFFETTPLQFVQVMKFKTEHFAVEEPQEFIGALRGLVKVMGEQKLAPGAASSQLSGRARLT